MSEGEDEGEYEGGRPLGLYLLVGVIVVLVAVSGMFAIGYIPPVAKLGSHASSTRTSVPFITVTTTIPPSTTTVTAPATTVTNTTVLTTTTTTSTTSTSTQTTTQTVTSTSVSTSTASTTIFSPTTTTSTTITTTSTTITTTSTTVAPPSPFTISIAMTPNAVPAALYAGESFVLNVTLQSTLPSTFASLNAYQIIGLNAPLVTSFFPSLPESLGPVIGFSYYSIAGTISPDAPTGSYEVDVEMVASSPVNNTQLSVTKQFLVNVLEPLSFTGLTFVNPTSQFNGTCMPFPLGTESSPPTWAFSCGINAAPMVNGTIDVTVSNGSNVPICIQTSFGSGTMTGYVKMDPYPFCPNGDPGVYVPAGAVNYVFTYLVENGTTAGLQAGFFTFTRAAT